jgi:hypothetical protein
VVIHREGAKAAAPAVPPFKLATSGESPTARSGWALYGEYSRAIGVGGLIDHELPGPGSAAPRALIRQPSKSPFQSNVLNEFARKGYTPAAAGQTRFHQHAPVIQLSRGAAIARTMRGDSRPIFFRAGAFSPGCDRHANGSELKKSRCRRYSIPRSGTTRSI